MDRSFALELFSSARVARMATVTAEGRPHIVPIVFAFDGPDLVTAVDQKPKRSRALARLDNIDHNSAVSMLVDHYAEDWTALWWVRIDGVAAVVDAGPRFHKAVTALVEKYEHYTSDAPRGPVVRVQVDRISGWRAQPDTALGTEVR